jgi:hypothetical protein
MRTRTEAHLGVLPAPLCFVELVFPTLAPFELGLDQVVGTGRVQPAKATNPHSKTVAAASLAQFAGANETTVG